LLLIRALIRAIRAYGLMTLSLLINFFKCCETLLAHVKANGHA
jgi:hypothetical protein